VFVVSLCSVCCWCSCRPSTSRTTSICVTSRHSGSISSPPFRPSAPSSCGSSRASLSRPSSSRSWYIHITCTVTVVSAAAAREESRQKYLQGEANRPRPYLSVTLTPQFTVTYLSLCHKLHNGCAKEILCGTAKRLTELSTLLPPYH